ncbi:MAG: DUF5060 domain-containing protein [Oscillospiraceae bacterium]|nr:DUF5060 domain-containing protein [Oscillospiraceae bacterium]
MTARQYETLELRFEGPEPEGSCVATDLRAVFSHGGEARTVKGFYAGNGEYRLRFLPEKSGDYTYRVTGEALPEPVEGAVEVLPADSGRHGPVRPDGTHLRCADGTWFHSFGTTVYGLAHQTRALIDETMDSLAASPFNKVRMCLFPKHYNYNFNEPESYPFLPAAGAAKRDFPPEETPVYPHFSEKRDDYWDVHHPDYAFWDRFEARMRQLQDMGLQIDLILFHPYDRWGFANLSPDDNLTYLDYLLRRFAAFPNVWWSLANEYDLCFNKTMEDWCAIEAFVAENDPYHHMLGNHNCFQMWDAGRGNITHISWQTKQPYRVAELMRRFGKPVLIDECRYEGTLPEFWGNLSGQDMARAFWRATVQGGYCTHGETFLPGTEMGDKATGTGEPEVVWWAKGGRLNGTSPARIAFLRQVVGELPGPLEPLDGMTSVLLGKSDPEAREVTDTAPGPLRDFFHAVLRMDRRERDHFIAAEYEYAGHCGEDAFLYYKDDQCCACADLQLPEGHGYRVEVLDTWEMARKTVLRGARGNVRVDLPGKPYMAVLAVREES